MAQQRQPQRDCIINGAGVDWITCSSTSPDSIRRYNREFGHLVADDHRDHYDVLPGGFHGYYGWRTRHAKLLRKEERTLFMVSGRAAQHASLLARSGDNCSRIDVQITLRLASCSVADYILAQHSNVREHRVLRGHKQRTELKIIDGESQTLYVGSRTSDVFIRIYDKYLESKDEAYKDCVRLEIEYKGKRSQAIWEALADGTLRGMSLLSMLLTDLSERGIDVEGIDIDRQDIRLPKPKTSKENVTLGWWARQVAPSVARHVAERGWYTAFSTLFHMCLTEWDRTLIMNSLSIQWGN